MATMNKNTDLKKLNKYFLGKGTVKIIPIPKVEDPIFGNLQSHWIKLHTPHSFNVECKMDVECPICEMLRPKTKWQKLFNKHKNKLVILIVLAVSCLGLYSYLMF